MPRIFALKTSARNPDQPTRSLDIRPLRNTYWQPVTDGGALRVVGLLQISRQGGGPEQRRVEQELAAERGRVAEWVQGVLTPCVRCTCFDA